MTAPPSPPSPISEYAQTCVRYVQSTVGLAPDFDRDTLPLLDHYLRTARADAAKRPETLPLLAAVAGAYFGELLRRIYASHWNVEDTDPTEWFIELDDLPIRIFPVAIAREALSGQPDTERETIVVNDELRTVIAERLERLPEVTQEDYLAPSTRLEVIEIAVDMLKARRNSPPDATE